MAYELSSFQLSYCNVIDECLFDIANGAIVLMIVLFSTISIDAAGWTMVWLSVKLKNILARFVLRPTPCAVIINSFPGIGLSGLIEITVGITSSGRWLDFWPLTSIAQNPVKAPSGTATLIVFPELIWLGLISILILSLSPWNSANTVDEAPLNPSPLNLMVSPILAAAMVVLFALIVLFLLVVIRLSFGLALNSKACSLSLSTEPTLTVRFSLFAFFGVTTSTASVVVPISLIIALVEIICFPDAS